MQLSSAPSRTFLRECFRVMQQKQLASTALQAGKTAAKDIGMKAIDVGKTVAIDAGKKLVEKAAKKLTTPKSQVANVVVPQIANVLVPPEEITKKVNEVIAKYVDTSAINLNKLIDGSSIKRQNASNAIAIQDLVKQLNGSALKYIYIFFLRLLKMMADIIKFTETPIIGESIESMSITNMNLLLAPVLITAVMSELVLNRKTYSHILARAT